MERIKLMSQKEVDCLIQAILEKNVGHEFALKYTHILHYEVKEECERRATEKLKEVAKEAYIDGLSARLEGEPFWGFESWWNQFLEEQESSEEKTS